MTASTIAVLAALTACTAPAAPAPADPGPLGAVVDTAQRRLATADTVAAAKWGTRGAIEDPAREKTVLDAAAAGSAPRGLDPAVAASVFRDQIEANKVVQYGLFESWTAQPQQAPATAPDLATVRPVLDAVTGQLLDALVATRDARSGAGCAAQLGAARASEVDRLHLDPLHQEALDRALRSVCGAR
ncbi:chorismate mutase [Pseudonocardia sp. GCM10023141]|uniref:chorismate mutase n=1 Tax=Pseudonocardia sp. GCM10023141 TaxID=3252653 RepID=UPI0036236295